MEPVDKTNPAAGASWCERYEAWINCTHITRFFKYLVLLIALGLTIRVVFDGFSYYVARRDIDAELQTKKNASLEYLDVLAQRDRALIIATLETRCMERAQLALFRIFDGQLNKELDAVSRDFIDQKGAIIDVIRRLGPGLINVEPAVRYVNGALFRVPDLDDYLKPLPGKTKDDVEYKKMMEEMVFETTKYTNLGARDHASVLKKAEDAIRKTGREPATYLSMDAIQTLEKRLERLKNERAKNIERVGDSDGVMVKYGVWTGALTGGLTSRPILDEMAYELRLEGELTLGKVNCNQFNDYYSAVNAQLVKEDPTRATAGEGISLQYRQFLATYFRQPPAAQTLFVTMFLGALGALTLNVLRLSKVGWWSKVEDPLWGEIIVCPLLGALAAFAIYLLGSAGLLLTTDTHAAQSSVTPLSAFFIGLLGFLSGLIYDEAFGRVRRVGAQLFADKAEDAAVNARREDRLLAETLKASNASLAAGLVLKYGVGTWVALESEFTLLVPSDEAVGKMAVKTWTELNDESGAAFKKWYHRHHAAKRITKKDVVGDGGTAAPAELIVDDGTTYGLAIEGGDLAINKVRVMIPDLNWGKGVIHILSQDFS